MSGWATFPAGGRDHFSQELLKTIPKKVINWLLSLNAELDGPWQYGRLEVNVSATGGAIILGGVDDMDYIFFSWEGEHNSPKAVFGSDPRLEDLKFNLDWFVGVENAIYTELTDFEHELLN